MALVIEQRFPLGRFHATRWNQNPFEDPYGEWPPSPWRLLRALASRWFQYARETDDNDEQKRNGLLQVLATSLPAFFLPSLTWRGAAIKQYQPTEVSWTDKAQKAAAYRVPQRTLTEDHYRALPTDKPVIWSWQEIELTDSQKELLDKLLERIHYFGRAETFCHMRRLDVLPDGVQPNTTFKEKDAGGMVPVLVPLPRQELNLKSLLAATGSDTLKGRPIPPGTAWYYVALPQRPVVTNKVKHVPCFSHDLNCLQFAVGGRVYPPLARWVKVTERFRGHVLKHLSAQITGDHRFHYGLLTPEQREMLGLLSGKNGEGHPLQGHQHAFFLLWPDNNGVPTRLVVWRRTPFTDQEIQALLAASERPISWANGAPDWAVRLVPLPFETSPPSGILSEARIWRSATPFVPPANRRRFRKNGRVRPGESPEQVLMKLLQADGNLLPKRVSSFEISEERSWVILHETRQRRQYRTETHTSWVRPGYWFQVEFEEPVRGPLIFGDSCHFGLGLFVPER
jgi:CRISPR-associated protein Csb2